MDGKELLRAAAANKIKFDYAHSGGSVTLMSALATERAEWHRRLEAGFAGIFQLVGYQPDRTTQRLTTPPILLASETPDHGQLTVRLNTLAGEHDRFSIVSAEFYDGDSGMGLESYQPSKLVQAALAEAYPAHHQQLWHSGSHESPVDEMERNDAQMNKTQDTIDLIWDALSNPALHPHMAQQIAEQRNAQQG